MKRVPYWFLLTVLFLTSCTSSEVSSASPRPRPLVVFAAASLSDAFTEIGENFESEYPGVTVTFNFAGSQSLRTQIEEGAPADVFASANQAEMDALITSGLVARGTPQVFVINRLVVILPAANPAGLTTLEELARPGIKLVLAAEEVPVGRYTREALNRMNGPFGAGFEEAVLANIVSNEDSVRQVVAKVQLGEADAGIVYTSDAVAASELETIEIPTALNVVAGYPIAAMAPGTDLAATFIEYVRSADGQSVLQKWGFASPE